MKHILCGLLEIVSVVDFGRGNFFREEIDSENVTFFHGIGEVTLVAAIVLKRGSDVPANFAMLAKCSTRFGTDVGHNFGARRSNWRSIEIVVTK